MATPAERKALLFVGIVALLGAGVRLWRAKTRPPAQPAPTTSSASPSTFPFGSSKKSKKKKKTNDRSLSDALDDEIDPEPVDLDVASLEEIQAIDVLRPGQARQIVADREANGPFGSIQALERIPYFPKATITKLAPRVTFSRLPRPPNAVIRHQSATPPAKRRTRRTRSSSKAR
jgi:hypothetical protein